MRDQWGFSPSCPAVKAWPDELTCDSPHVTTYPASAAPVIRACGKEEQVNETHHKNRINQKCPSLSFKNVYIVIKDRLLLVKIS